MWKYLAAILAVVFLSFKADGQVIIQTFVDPCTKTTNTFVIPATGGVTIVFYNKSRSFNAADVYSGAFTQWINSVYEEYRAYSPCSVSQTTQTSTQITASAVSNAVSSAVSAAASTAASQAASSAASSAASAAASSAASSASSSAASSASSSAVSSSASSQSSSSGSSGSSSESSNSSSSSSESSSSKSSDSKSSESSSSEKSSSKSSSSSSKSSSKSEKKSESKSSQAKVNPILFNSDLTGGQTMSGSINLIVTGGMSQSSMTGASSWGLTGMVWSNLQQFALSGRYTAMNFDGGKLSNISNWGATIASAFGNMFGFVTYAKIFPMGKWGVTGANMTLAFQKSGDEMTSTHSLLLFYTKPIPLNRRFTISPDIYLSGSPVTYYSKQNKWLVSHDMGVLTGFGLDYAITKRFKFNVGAKTSISTNPSVPTLFFAVVGSKVNL